MNIYFFTSQPKISNRLNQIIIKILHKAGVKIYSNVEGLSGVEFPKGTDALLILGDAQKHKAHEIAYVLALGIARNKPILYCLPKGSSIPLEIFNISKSKEVKKKFYLKFFTKKNLPGNIQDFLSNVKTNKNELNVKFTLRLNTALNQYLVWKSKKLKITKADFLRKLIEQSRTDDSR